MAIRTLVPCRNCSQPTKKTESKSRTGKPSQHTYCCRACYDAYRAKEIASRVYYCDNCGKECVDVHNRANKFKRVFCGESCRRSAFKAKPKHCVNCGCWFTAVRLHRAYGKFISLNNMKLCSKECQQEWLSNNQDRKDKISRAFTGDKHPNWMGGKSRSRIGNRGPGWQRQRRKAISRDGFKCVDCGITQGDHLIKYGSGLEVDHIEPFHNFGNSQQANRLSNLETRCKSCHRRAEAKRSFVQITLPLAVKDKNNHRGGYCRGEKINTAKLNPAKVMDIRKRVATGESCAALSKEYGVGVGAISAVAERKTWRHLA